MEAAGPPGHPPGRRIEPQQLRRRLRDGDAVELVQVWAGAPPAAGQLVAQRSYRDREQLTSRFMGFSTRRNVRIKQKYITESTEGLNVSLAS